MPEFVFVEERPENGVERPVAGGQTIGREGCDVDLLDADASRRHAALHDLDGALAIEDLNSTNGTFVNEHAVSGVVPLRAGDRVRLGSTVWRLDVRRASAADQALEQTLARSRPRVTDEHRGSEPAQEQARVTAPVRPAANLLTLGPPQFEHIASKAAPRRRGSAARRAEATVLSYALVVGTALAVAAYLAER